MAHNTVNFGKCSTYTWKKCVSCCCCIDYFIIAIKLVVFFRSFLTLLIFCLFAHWETRIWETSSGISHYNCRFIWFSFQFVFFFNLTYFEDLLVCAKTFRIVMSCWWKTTLVLYNDCISRNKPCSEIYIDWYQQNHSTCCCVPKTRQVYSSVSIFHSLVLWLKDSSPGD